MKRAVRSYVVDPEIIEDKESRQVIEDDFDDRWNDKFGEPSTEVFEPDDFNAWMQEVMDFE